MSMMTNLLTSITRPMRMPKYLKPNTPEANKWMDEHKNSPNGLSYLAVSGLGLAAASIGLGLLGIKGDNETSKLIGGTGTAAAIACIGLDYISRYLNLSNEPDPTDSHGNSNRGFKPGAYGYRRKTLRDPISTVASHSGTYSGFTPYYGT